MDLRATAKFCPWKKKLERAKVSLARYMDGKSFSDENFFMIEVKFGRVEQGHRPTSVMVWWGMSYEGTTKLHFCEQGVKIKAETLRETS